jgi:predicted dehydrogenase
MEDIKIGIIGMSHGNGHPYSWSAIVNGYDHEYMKDCPFPVIPDYLKKQKWPDSSIKGANVNSIWTQSKTISKHIAQSTYIKHVCEDIDKLLEYSDCIMLARDDYKNHNKFSKIFLDSGLPIYIDKPIATSISQFEKIYKNEKYEGQIFTCSALRYCSDLNLSISDKNKIGEIEEIKAITPKEWDKYSIHIIEPVLNILPSKLNIKSSKVIIRGKSKQLDIVWDSNQKTSLISSGEESSQIKITVSGTKGSVTLIHKDTFMAFKKSIEKFLYGIRNKTIESPMLYNKKIVDIINRGLS